MRTFLFLSLSFALLLQSGCSKDDGRPNDLPKLHPVSITVIQDGKPLEGAAVTLIAKTQTLYGMASGTTNASGIAVPRTYGYDGVPVGQYMVTVSKAVVEGAREAKNDDGSTYETGGKNYQYVDVKFTKQDTTTLDIDVTEKGAKETFDVGAAVHVFLSENE